MPSCSRGALLEGAREAERDAAPARVVRTHSVREAGVTRKQVYAVCANAKLLCRAYNEALPRDGWTRTGRRRRNPPDDAGVWPVACPGSTVPSPKIAASGAPQGDAVRFPPHGYGDALQLLRLRLAARHAPRFRGVTVASLAASAGEIARVAV